MSVSTVSVGVCRAHSRARDKVDAGFANAGMACWQKPPQALFDTFIVQSRLTLGVCSLGYPAPKEKEKEGLGVRQGWKCAARNARNFLDVTSYPRYRRSCGCA